MNILNKLIHSLFFAITIVQSASLFANYDADWSSSAYIPEGENRANIYQVDDLTLKKMKESGYIHAQVYPVTVSGLLIPYRPLVNFLNSKSDNPLRKLIYDLGREMTGFKSEQDLYETIGLSPNLSENESDVFKIPFPNGKKDNFYIGAGTLNVNNADGLTFSCFACHAQNMFGKVVIGLTNKHSRANEFFHLTKNTLPYVPSPLFALSTGASADEVAMFNETKKNLLAVDALNPQVEGLDTSLSQVALSLSRRNPDDYATKSTRYETYPRDNELKRKIADSKPMPWWNAKYKTRWLSDGSIVQGNPIYTNFLWNEIGRGTDLKKLEQWMNDNRQKIDELTASVFATEAPHWTDFFEASTISLERAKRGEAVFNNTCSRCHGTYEKGWSEENADMLSASDLLKTVRVVYHDRTPVIDVGTDPGRYEGMKYFSEALNKLAISKKMNTVVVPQKGYVPSPLVGIWMRYPYLHNNSIPNLCALMTPPSLRPKKFVQGPSANAKTDFDFECVGYPVGEKMPKEWSRNTKAIFDVTKEGLSNKGHYQMFLDEAGHEKLSALDKKDLIEFLKTL